LADDIPARSGGSPASAEPVPVSPAADDKLAAAAARIVSIWREYGADSGLLHIVFHDPGPMTAIRTANSAKSSRPAASHSPQFGSPARPADHSAAAATTQSLS
jgi:hypothetical protein